MLPDSGRIQEEDAANANRHWYSKHSPALPLYTEADAFRALSLLQPVGYDRPMPVADGVEADFINAGHLLGSAYARVRAGGMTILFGGDLGRFGRPVLPDPTMVDEADYLLVESTYGNRVHEKDDDGEQLARGDQGDGRARRQADHSRVRRRPRRGAALLDQAARGARSGFRCCPVFVDSPMATEALARYTERLQRARSRAAARGARRQGAARRSAAHEPRDERREQARAGTAGVRLLHRALPHDRVAAAESKQLTQSKMPAIVISSSGMATGGRVLHHLKAALPDPRNTVLLVGFQAEGTRGRQLADGAPAVKIHGQVDSRARPRREDRFDVGPRRFAGDPALARRIHAPAAA